MFRKNNIARKQFLEVVEEILFILSTFVIGIVLMFLHLPCILELMSPLWLVLILLYWVLVRPQYAYDIVSLCVGVFLDVVYNTTLGEHSLALLFIVFLFSWSRKKIVIMSFVNQVYMFFWAVFFYQIFIVTMSYFVDCSFNLSQILLSSIVGTGIWAFFVVFYWKKKLSE